MNTLNRVKISLHTHNCFSDTLCILTIVSKKDKIKALLCDIAEVWPTDLSDNKIKEVIKRTWLRRVRIFVRGIYYSKYYSVVFLQ